MKIFDWVHKKLRPSCIQTSTKQHVIGDNDRSSRGSLADLLIYDQFSRVKTNHHEDGSSFKMLHGNIELGDEEPSKENTVEHCSYNADPCEDKEAEAVMVRDLQHGQLAIRTSSKSKLQPSLDELKVLACENNQVNTVVDSVTIDGEKFRRELEKALYNKLSEEDASRKTKETSKRGRDREPKKEKKHFADTDMTKRRISTGRKVFPLRDFLEVPHTPNEDAVASKTKTKGNFSSCSNLFNGPKSSKLYENIIHNDRSPKKFSPETADHKRSTTSLLKRLMLKTRGTPPYSGEFIVHRSGLEKILHAIRKDFVSVPSCFNGPRTKKLYDKEDRILHAATLHERGGLYKAWAQPKQDTTSNTGNVAADNRQPQDLGDKFETFIFEDWTNGFSPHICWLPTKDSSALNDMNEYWIKTDDEYVVLEL